MMDTEDANNNKCHADNNKAHADGHKGHPDSHEDHVDSHEGRYFSRLITLFSVAFVIALVTVMFWALDSRPTHAERQGVFLGWNDDNRTGVVKWRYKRLRFCPGNAQHAITAVYPNGVKAILLPMASEPIRLDKAPEADGYWQLYVELALPPIGRLNLPAGTKLYYETRNEMMCNPLRRLFPHYDPWPAIELPIPPT